MKRLITYLILSVALITTIQAQESMNQEVRVVKPYEPVISDAFKISELPKIVDTIKVDARFEYEIAPVQHATSFSPSPINAARLISEPLSKLYYGYAKAGFGSYLSPMAEVYLGSKRSENWRWNALLNYHSSNGKIKNSADQKVYAGLSDAGASFNASRFFNNNTTLKAEAAYGNHKNYYYGFDPEWLQQTNTTAPLLKDDMEHQVLNIARLGARFETNHLDSTHVNYFIDANWQSTMALNNIGENVLHVKSSLDYFFEREFVGADVGLTYINNHGLSNKTNAALFRFSPWVGAFGDKWRIVAGVHTVFDQANEDYKFYPRISMHYNIIDYFLIPYFELDGTYEENSYYKVYKKNPFINQSLSVKPTDTRLNLTFGFRGNISSKVAFNAKVNYAQINNMYFFVTDTNTLLRNKFTTVGDTLTRIRLLGELSYKTSEKLWLSVKTNLYKYEMGSQLKPWHLPTFDLSVNARYRIQDKITLDVNVFGIGSRYARSFDENNQLVAKELQGIIDLNIGLEYRLTRILSAFAYFNNISSVKYYPWHNYPSQRFNVMLGATYSF
ncbi:MAG: hypothetical protein AB7E36_04700 [Salinivirgaceae bacterium]